MRLLDAYSQPLAAAYLYLLFCERPKESWISRTGMVSFAEHKKFLESRPFRYWLLIEETVLVGAIEVTDRNEIGIAIDRQHQRKGYGLKALELFMSEYQPLPAIPALRNGRWLANIACGNESSKAFFRRAGFTPLQETFIYG